MTRQFVRQNNQQQILNIFKGHKIRSSLTKCNDWSLPNWEEMEKSQDPSS